MPQRIEMYDIPNPVTTPEFYLPLSYPDEVLGVELWEGPKIAVVVNVNFTVANGRKFRTVKQGEQLDQSPNGLPQRRWKYIGSFPFEKSGWIYDRYFLFEDLGDIDYGVHSYHPWSKNFR